MEPGMDGFGPMLGVWAHPDDETYLTAGLMAASVQAGDRVVCVTATKGEAGSWDEDRWPSSQMGEVRAQELLSSLAILGVKEHHWLGYHDGRCAEVDPEEATTRIQAFVQEVQPRSVFTFGPDGMTGHPDHKAVSAWTREAFHRAAQDGARLFYATTTPEWAERFVPMMNRFNVFMEEGTPPVTPRDELAIDYELSPELMELKLAAFEAHISQVEGMLNAFGKDFFRESYSSEIFRLADHSR